MRPCGVAATVIAGSRGPGPQQGRGPRARQPRPAPRAKL